MARNITSLRGRISVALLHWLHRRFHVVAITFLIGTLFTTILLHEIASSSHHPTIITLPHSNDDDDIANANNTSPKIGSSSNIFPLKQDTTKSCPPYGCQIYPIDYTTIKQGVPQKNDGDDGKLYAAFTQKGRDHTVNQDRGILLLPSLDDKNQDTNGTYFGMGIFDGHGDEGHNVAHHIQQNLFQRLHEKLARKEEMESALTNTFIELDRELDDNIGNNGGSTTAIVIRQGSVLYFASVGDSLCLVCDKQGNILFQTRNDKAHMPEEYNRIIQMGGEGTYSTPASEASSIRCV